MRLLLLIGCLAFSSVSECNRELVGRWEAFARNGNMYGSAILNIDSMGKGYFAYTIGRSLDENLVVKIDLSQSSWRNGYFEIQKEHEHMRQVLLLSPDMGEDLNAIIIVAASENGNAPLFSIPWGLTKIEGDFRDQSLYELAENSL